MAFTGFQIRRIIAFSEEKNDVFLNFEDGLNVVSGPSDTGKSFILELLDFMMGASSPPKKLEEGKEFSKFFLEIQSNDGAFYTLERHRNGGDFRLYEERYDLIANNTNYEELYEKHNAHNEDNISSFLLKLSNLSNKKLLKSVTKNKPQNLTFRTLKNFVAVDEERIITKNSIINVSGQRDDKTVDSTLFKLLITGDDYTGYISKKEVASQNS